MPTLTTEQTLTSLFSPEPFGLNGVTLTQEHKHILLNVLTFNVFDAVYVYSDKFTHHRFNSNGCTEFDFNFQYVKDDESTDKLEYLVEVTPIIGKVFKGKENGEAIFDDKPGFKYDNDSYKINMSNELGLYEENEFTVTMVNRTVKLSTGVVALERDELHICLPDNN